MTTDLIIDVGTETVEVSSPRIDLEIEVDSPSLVLDVPGPRGQTGHQIVFGTQGPVSTKIGSVGYFPRVGGRIIRVTAAVSTQFSGSTVVDVNICTPTTKTTVFTDPNHRPTLASTGRHYDDGQVDAGVFTAEDYFTCDVDTAGVGTTDLIVTVDYIEE